MMNDTTPFFKRKRFMVGLGLFIFSATTVAFVTDSYVMLDISFIMISVYLMVTSFYSDKGV